MKDSVVVFALIAASVLGIWFSNTRWISVATTAVLCTFYPWLTAFVVIGSAWAFFHFKIRK